MGTRSTTKKESCIKAWAAYKEARREYLAFEATKSINALRIAWLAVQAIEKALPFSALREDQRDAARCAPIQERHHFPKGSEFNLPGLGRRERTAEEAVQDNNR